MQIHRRVGADGRKPYGVPRPQKRLERTLERSRIGVVAVVTADRTVLYYESAVVVDRAAVRSTVAAERAERIAGDVTLTNTVNDSVSGSQQGTLTAQQAAELSAVNSVMQQTYSDFVTGRASLNPQPVSLYSSPAPCGCPGSCGCNG